MPKHQTPSSQFHALVRGQAPLKLARLAVPGPRPPAPSLSLQVVGHFLLSKPVHYHRFLPDFSSEPVSLIVVLFEPFARLVCASLACHLASAKVEFPRRLLPPPFSGGRASPSSPTRNALTSSHLPCMSIFLPKCLIATWSVQCSHCLHDQSRLAGT